MMKPNAWLAGVLTTLFTGLILWWLTDEGGPLNPGKPPHLAIIAWNYSQPDKNHSAYVISEGRLTVHNDGESTAENCAVYDEKNQVISGFGHFGVRPKEHMTVSVWVSFPTPEHVVGPLSRSLHSFRATAWVKCDKGVSSDVFEREMWLEEP